MFSARLRRGPYQRLQVARRISDAGQHGRADYPSRDARLVQLLYGLQAQIRTRGARLQNARQVNLQSGDRDVDEQAVVFCDLLQHIDVTQYKIGFGDNADFESAMPRQFLEDRPRHFETPLGGLIRIRSGADCDFFSSLDVAQFLPEQVPGVLLDEDFLFEVDAVAHFHELVGVACIAVFAVELASALGVDCA